MDSYFNDTIDYLQENMCDPTPQYILAGELQKQTVTESLLTRFRESKWYQQLLKEQQEDGSFGRFHSMDSSVKKRKFSTTEAALLRMHDLGLCKNDPMLIKTIQLLIRYINGEQTWTDTVEKHKDNGKGHLHSRFYISAADLCIFDPKNPLLSPFYEVCVNQLANAFRSGNYDEEAWEARNKDYTGCNLQASMAYPVRLIQNADILEETLQRRYLDYLFHHKEGIYYVSNAAPILPVSVEDKYFSLWLYALDTLSGFSLFPEYAKPVIVPHLLNEMRRLRTEEIHLPSSGQIIGRYSENTRTRDAGRNDLLLRMVRILNKCDL